MLTSKSAANAVQFAVWVCPHSCTCNPKQGWRRRAGIQGLDVKSRSKAVSNDLCASNPVLSSLSLHFCAFTLVSSFPCINSGAGRVVRPPVFASTPRDTARVLGSRLRGLTQSRVDTLDIQDSPLMLETVNCANFCWRCQCRGRKWPSFRSLAAPRSYIRK